jgi:16S rRNA (adenine1518-N6/adenine1519-N6)-dimethyltransferase
MPDPDLKQRARDFHAKRRLGQNFLVNPERLSEIAHAIDILPSDHVLEIGPGLGFLTTRLAALGARLTAVELDRECISTLDALSLPRFNLIHADFLECDLASILSEKTKIIGNIPFNITTPIIARLLGEIGEPSPWLSQIDSVVLTVQREVGRRLVARPGDDDYSQITLLIDYFAKSELLFMIQPDEFYPVPDVTSAVVRLVPHAAPPVQCADTKLLRQLIQAGFRQRRKMLRNNLGFLKLPQARITEVFEKLNFDPQVRAERLSLKQFAMMSDAFSQTNTHPDDVKHGAPSTV